MEFDFKVDEFSLSIYETRKHEVFALYHSCSDYGYSYKFVDDINKLYFENAEWLFEDMMTNFTISDEYNQTVAHKVCSNYLNQRANHFADFYDLLEEVDVSPEFHLIANYSCDLGSIYFKIDWDSLETENAIFFLDLFNIIFKYCADNEVNLIEEDYYRKSSNKIHIEF